MSPAAPSCNDLWCLSAIFTCAEEWEWITGNPVAAYIRGRAKRGLLLAQPSRTRYCGHDEEDELLSRCKGKLAQPHSDAPADHVMLMAGIALTIDIGLRKEELLAGTWPMVNLEANEWNVPVGLAKTGRKTGVGRSIPILPRSQAILESLPRSNQVPYVLWHAQTVIGDDGQRRVVHERYTSLLSALQDIATGGRATTFRREASKLIEKGLKLTPARRAEIDKLSEELAWASPIPGLWWHDLRRTCGCRLLQDYKMKIEAVSKWLGHSSIEQTQRAYAFLEVEHLHAAVGTQKVLESPRHTLLLEAKVLQE